MAFEIIKRIFGGRRLPVPDPDEPGFHTYAQSSGLLTAIPAAYAAIGLLASTLAQLPRTVARLEDPLDDYWQADPEHPVSELLRRPSRLVDPWIFWEWMLRCLFGFGNAYSWIRRDSRGRPVELVPANCTRCQWVDGSQGSIAEYDLALWGATDNGGSRQMLRVPASEVVVLHGPGFDGLASPSPVQHAARRTLEVMDQAMGHEGRLLRGAGLRTAIQMDVALLELSNEQQQQYRDQLKRIYQDAREKGEVPVLPPGFTAASTGGMSAVDIQVIELLKWSVEDIARVWNVPLRLLHQYYEGQRVTQFEQQAVDFERWSLRGHVHRIEEQLSAKLLSHEEARDDLVIRLPTDRIRAGSWSEQVNAVDQAVAKAGVMTVNEGRRRLRLPPREDGDRLIQPKGAPAQDMASEPSSDDDEQQAA